MVGATLALGGDASLAHPIVATSKAVVASAPSPMILFISMRWPGAALVVASLFLAARAGAAERCTTSKDCPPLFECDFTFYCVPGFDASVCTATGVGVLAKDGTLTPCSPYRCASDGGVCRSTCETDDDCDEPHQCVDGACVDPPDAATTPAADTGDARSSCAYAPAPPASPVALLALLLACKVTLRSRVDRR
jgi:hypothetical protein